jgi:hypothetical protein
MMRNAIVLALASLSVLAADRDIWPSFAPYVEHLQLTDAILTATTLDRRPGGVISTWRNYTNVRSGVPRIVESDGTPFAFMTTPPTVPGP